MEVLVDEFLKVKSYERTRRKVRVDEGSTNHGLQSFVMFLQQGRKLRQSSKLSFALNLEKDDVKFSVKNTISNQKSKRRINKVTKDEIPAEFMKKIVRLGFQNSDAEVLYDNKDDWMGIDTG